MTGAPASLATQAWGASSNRSSWAKTGPNLGPSCSFFEPGQPNNCRWILLFLECCQGLAMSLTASREEPPVPDWSGVLFFQQRESEPSLACLDRQNPGRASKSPNPSGWRQTNPAMILSGFFSQNTRKYLHMHVFLQKACRSSWTRRLTAPLGLTVQREGLPLPRTSSTTCRVSSFWSSAC